MLLRFARSSRTLHRIVVSSTQRHSVTAAPLTCIASPLRIALPLTHRIHTTTSTLRANDDMASAASSAASTRAVSATAFATVPAPHSIRFVLTGAPQNASTVVVFTTEEEADGRFAKSPVALSVAADSPAAQDFKGKKSALQLLYGTDGRRVLFVGLGKQENVTVDVVRSATHAAVARLRQLKLANASVVVPASIASVPLPAALDAVTRTAVLSNWVFDAHLTKNKPDYVQELQLVVPEKEIASLQKVVDTAQTITECTLFARELGNTRADIMNPAHLASLAQDLAKTHGLKSTVLDEKQLRDQGYHLLTAVGQAAQHTARLVVIEYKGNAESKENIAIVGKGITFDSGGLNLKPTGGIETMYLDMSGAAVVLATIKALALLKPKVNVIGVAALAENAIDSLAYKPHQIIPSAKGTVEIGNTDAEGRLALADALTYVQKHYEPKQIIDLATLTGACVVALGEYMAGVFSNDDDLAHSLVQSGKKTFERCWRLPLADEYTDELKGTYSDWKSTGNSRNGGASIAASFLQIFIEKGVKWAHVDIAGPAMYSSARDFMPKNGTGFGVQLLCEYLASQAKA